jgi:hypothetical protein
MQFRRDMQNSLIDQQSAAQKVAEFVAPIIADIIPGQRTGYLHMGATLTDTVLQAGLSYRSVVFPRVQRLLSSYPHANTTSRFTVLLHTVGPSELLQWSHPEKISRLVHLTEFLLERSVETESDLYLWFGSPDACGELLAIKGIGPKTVDYLKILVGLPTVAVDRHVKTLCHSLGFEFKRYSEFRNVLCIAAEILAIAPQVLDGILWQYLSSRSERGDS